MLRNAEGTLDPWNARRMHGGRRSKERGRDGHGTKTLASLYTFPLKLNLDQEQLFLKHNIF
jgi:hypothetical protein